MACGFCGKEGHRQTSCPRKEKPPKLTTRNTDGSTRYNINENKVLEAVSKLIKGKKAFVIGVTSNLERLRLSSEINRNYIEIRTMWASTSQASIVQKWAEVLAHVSKKKEAKNLISTYPSDVDSNNKDKPRLFLYVAFR
jgi:hypothetical protein